MERAVESAAVVLLVAGAAFVVLWALLRSRRRRLAWVSLAASVLALAGGAGLGAWAWHETRDREVIGSPTIEFLPTLKPPRATKRSKKLIQEEPWPLYGYDAERTRSVPFDVRPPFRGLWRVRSGHVLEPPPVVAYGRVYFAHQRGRVLAVNAIIGKVLWTRQFRHCSAASAAVGKRVLYQPFMHRFPCQKHLPGARGFIAALDADSGRTLWKFEAGAIESSPLLLGNTLYFGSWDRKIYALDVRTRKVRWTYETDDRVVAAPAHSGGTIYVGTNGGRLYAINARTGRLRWRAESFSRFGRREYFYATPAVAYGRVFIGNTDGTIYAFGARSGRLLWARQAGTYVYAAPAVWRKTVYVGTWDGWFTAYDASTGRIRWRFDSPGGIMGAPTVMAGLVYFSTWGKFRASHGRRVEDGRRRTFALNARTGKLVWRFWDGHYSAIVADAKRVYLVGRTSLYGLTPRRRRALASRARDRAKPAAKRARSRSAARRGTTSGRRD
jgi:outer membrane protein assembly factor BamB